MVSSPTSALWRTGRRLFRKENFLRRCLGVRFQQILEVDARRDLTQSWRLTEECIFGGSALDASSHSKTLVSILRIQDGLGLVLRVEKEVLSVTVESNLAADN